jgi:IS605 OrfB family transposase
VEKPATVGTKEIGIDLGLKDLITISDGGKFNHPKWYKKLEEKIKMSQRLKKIKNTQRLHRKAKNQRRDFLHKISSQLVEESHAIFIGNVSSASLVKTRMATSVLDAGWSTFKTFLHYKSITRKCLYREVDERFTTQTCANCQTIGGPKGLQGLGVREWVCSVCNSVHDRDINAAMNILQLGHQLLMTEVS